eukprot:PhM_4_TR7348/c0_g1_i1/m.18471
MEPSQCQAKAKELYDRWTSHISVLTAEERGAVEREATELVSSIGTVPPASLDEKGRYHYVVGKLMVVGPASQLKEAEANLSRAVKACPENPDAWVCLGEVYWRKDSIEEARKALETALDCAKAVEDKEMIRVAQRELGRVAKYCGASAEEKVAARQVAIDAAKAAVGADLSDASSWYVLGHALLAEFISRSGGNIKDLQRCVQAFRQAKRCSAGPNMHPDVLYNLGIVLRFQGRYGEAHECLSEAYRLDPSSLVSAKHVCEDIVSILSKARRVVQNSGGANARSIAKRMPREGRVLADTTSPNGAAVPILLLDILSQPNTVPVAVVGVDRSKQFVVVLLYNVQYKAVKCYDVVTCLFPPSSVERMTATIAGEEYDVTVVIPDTDSLMWNGKTAESVGILSTPSLVVRTFS